MQKDNISLQPTRIDLSWSTWTSDVTSREELSNHTQDFRCKQTIIMADTVNLSDIKTSLDSLHVLVYGLKSANEDKDKKIDSLIHQVSSLQKLVVQKDQKIIQLENKVLKLEEEQDEMKRYSLKNNVIIKGLTVTKPVPRSYAAAAQVEEAPSLEAAPESVDSVRAHPTQVKTFNSTRKQIVEFVNTKMHVKITEDDISAAHVLKKGDKDEVPPLIVRFVTTACKQDVMSARKLLKKIDKGKGPIYMNDQLTRTSSELFRDCRKMWQQKEIAATWTTLGKVFAKKHELSRPVWVQSTRDLQKLLVNNGSWK